jgi:type I protein arginine methyltransferase
MYSLSGYVEMLADSVRMRAYESALQAVVTRDSIVLDIGTGLGVTAIIAARLGARHVIAIEPDEVVEVARMVAIRNGVGDRIEFRKGLSTALELPDTADVIVSDLRGVLPLFGSHVESIRDARDRLLTPGGVLIPKCDYIRVALVEAPEIYYSGARGSATPNLMIDLTDVHALGTNGWGRQRFEHHHIVGDISTWAEIDYESVVTPHFLRRVVTRAPRSATLHGIGAWFDTVLHAGVGFSNAPGEPPAIYGHAFFPFTTPLVVAASDEIEVDMRARLVNNEYVWTWNATVRDSATGAVIASRRQSSLLDGASSINEVMKSSDRHAPARNVDGDIDLFILSQMDGTATSGAIAERLAEAFPSHFSRTRDALARVAAIARSRST